MGVGAGVESCLVSSQAGITISDDSGLIRVGRGRRVLCRRGGGWLGGGQGTDRLVEAVWGEEGAQPAVEGGQDVVLPEVDVDRMLDVGGEGIFAGVAAAVVGVVVAALGLHLASA